MTTCDLQLFVSWHATLTVLFRIKPRTEQSLMPVRINGFFADLTGFFRLYRLSRDEVFFFWQNSTLERNGYVSEIICL